MKETQAQKPFKAPRRTEDVSNTDIVQEAIIAKDQIKSEPLEADIPEVENQLCMSQNVSKDDKENVFSKPALKENMKEEINNGGKEKKKKVMRSMTDAEYEEIFSAVLRRSQPSEEIVSQKSIDTCLPADHHESDDDHPVDIMYDLGEEPVVSDEHMPGGTFDDMDLENMPEDIKAEVKAFSEGVSPPRQPRTIGTLTPVKATLSQGKKQNPVKSSFSQPLKQSVSASSQGHVTQNDKPNSTRRPKFSAHSKENKKSNEIKSPRMTHRKDSKNKCDRREKMKKRKIEETGTWVQCTKRSCMKWRYLPDLHDPATLPDVWTCAMSDDNLYNDCEMPEEEFDESEHNQQYVFTRYTEGSLVWARMSGYPWWPAMVEIDPDFENYFECRGFDNVASHYHVVFFDDRVSRAWVSSSQLMPFIGNEQNKELSQLKSKHGEFKKSIEVAREKAIEAQNMTIKDRLQTFSFANRYKGKWGKDSDKSQDARTSKKKSRKRKHKTTQRSDTHKSLTNNQHELEDQLPDHLDVLQSQSEEDLFSSAEALLKDAEDVLSEFFSSQHDAVSEYGEESPVKKKKKAKHNKKSDGELKKTTKKIEKTKTTKSGKETPMKQTFGKKSQDKILLGKTSKGPVNADKKKSLKPKFEKPIKVKNVASENSVEKDLDILLNTGISKNEKSENQTNTNSSNTSKTTPEKAMEALNNAGDGEVHEMNRTAKSQDCSQSSAKDKSSHHTGSNSQQSGKLETQTKLSLQKKTKRFSAPIVKSTKLSKSDENSASVQKVDSASPRRVLRSSQSETDDLDLCVGKSEGFSAPTVKATNLSKCNGNTICTQKVDISSPRRVLHSSQSQHDETDDLDLDLFVSKSELVNLSQKSSQNIIMHQSQMSTELKKTPSISQTVDEDSEPLDFEE